MPPPSKAEFATLSASCSWGRAGLFTAVCLVVGFLAPLIAPAAEIRISSFNVNYANDRIRETFELIAKANPDVILLQESTDKFKKGAKDWLPSDYRHSWFVHDDKHPAGGFAVISKQPLIGKKFVEKSTGAFGAQKFGVRVGEGVVHFVNVHLNPAGLPRPFNRPGAMHAMMMNNKTQALEIRNLLKHCDKNVPTIIAGDLNSFPNMAACKELRAGGFTDVHLERDPRANAVPTWRMQVDGVVLQGRFDYVFRNRFLESTEFKVVENHCSDHTLVNCVLRLKE